MVLLERDSHLSLLRQSRVLVRDRRSGLLVLVDGEAGAGKTALLRHFCDPLGYAGPGVDSPAGDVGGPMSAGAVLWGACEPLFTPAPLGPFRGMAGGARAYEVVTELTRVARERPGTVVVLEDLHWADEATLDVLSLLGRRLATVPALVVATYRSDGLDRRHPLREALGELHSGAVRRLTVGALSASAIRVMAAPGHDAAAVHRATSGNAFFVAEVLAQAPGAVPPTAGDAVLARTSRLSPAATTVLQAVSIAPDVSPELLDALAGDVPDVLPERLGTLTAGAIADGLSEAVAAGILRSAGGAVSFRHEIARLAVEGTLTPQRRRHLHERALATLTAGGPLSEGVPGEGFDLSRVTHHAEAAGDAEAVLRYAPLAAERAAAAGAHREAAAQYGRALRFGGALNGRERAELLERRSHECCLTDQTEASIEALREAVACRRAAGDTLGTGAALSTLSRRLWAGGRGGEAATVAREAVRLLPAGPELAAAYGELSQVHLNAEEPGPALSWARKAMASGLIMEGLDSVGTVRLLAGDQRGRDDLTRSLEMAERAGSAEGVGRVFVHVGWAMTRTRQYDLMPWVQRGIATCERLGLEAWRHYLLAYRARFHLDRGRWDAALADGAAVLRSSRTVPLLRVLGLTVIARVQARRGDADPWPALDEALDLARGRSELQFLAPVAVARAEASWLAGDGVRVREEVALAYPAAVRARASWVTGELTWLLRLAGCALPARDAAEGASTPDRLATASPALLGGQQVQHAGTTTSAASSTGADRTHLDGGMPLVADSARPVTPYDRQWGGDLGGAAVRWNALDCPFDAALALAGSPDEGALRRSLAELQRLDARPAAAIVARRLREKGVRDVPRRRTREGPDLTAREAEVLALVRQGLSNSEIAAKTAASRKSVDQHVSAILRKLGVSRRSLDLK